MSVRRSCRDDAEARQVDDLVALLTSQHRQIESLVRNTFGPQMGYELELVDAIPQEASGKYRFCVSPVATAYLKSLAP